MDILVAQTEQSVYIIGSYGPTTQAVLSRTPVGIDGLSYEQDQTYSGEVVNTPVEVGKRMEWLRSSDGHTIHSTPVISVAKVGPSSVLQDVEYVVAAVLLLGRTIGFEGISRQAGMKSVEAILEDVLRAVRKGA